jgi:thiol-disulfide isomerase/thioredoxin
MITARSGRPCQPIVSLGNPMSNSTQPDPVNPPQRKLSSSWTTAILIAVLVSLAIRFVAQHAQKHESATEQPGVGQPLPMLELQPLTGATDGISLKDLRGKVTLINYWGPWCGYCIQEFPHLVELWDKNRGNADFAFVSVSSGGSPKEDVTELRQQTQRFLDSRSATFPTYVDPDGANRQILMSIADMDGFGYPTTVLLDRNGIIRAIWLGYEPGTETEMEQLVSKLLAEKPAT